MVDYYLIKGETLTGIADAIRAKTNKQDTTKPEEQNPIATTDMPELICSIGVLDFSTAPTVDDTDMEHATNESPAVVKYKGEIYLLVKEN